MKVVVEHAKGEGNEKHATTVDKLVFDYIRATRKMQHMDTPSGGFRSGGLGEVKFYVDATPYTGRFVIAGHQMYQEANSVLPAHTAGADRKGENMLSRKPSQAAFDTFFHRDGPALRATTLINFAEDLLDTDAARWQNFVKEELYDSKAVGETESIIKADLDYVVE